jgi:hypothetical protein
MWSGADRGAIRQEYSVDGAEAACLMRLGSMLTYCGVVIYICLVGDGRAPDQAGFGGVGTGKTRPAGRLPPKWPCRAD